MLMQVLSLTPDQISALPNDQRAGVMQLVSRVQAIFQFMKVKLIVVFVSDRNLECDDIFVFC
jgi:hypothetical protein